MSVDLSVRRPNKSAIRMANALLRASGGMTAFLQVGPTVGDDTDAGQLGLDAPNFQNLPLSPVVFRRVRATMQEKKTAVYELLISASTVVQQVSALQLVSAAVLFDTAAGVLIEGEKFLIESHSVSESFGQVYLYRLLLREPFTS